MAPTPEHSDQMVYAGIDEAGYGPRIGPLTVAMSAFRVPVAVSSASPDGLHGAAPDLWRLLRAAVGKAKQAAGKRAPVIYVDDSKLLKGSNGLKRRHPLDRLEQGVLSFLRTLDQTPASDLELFKTLGANVELAPWYRGEPIPTPVSTTSAHIGVLANALRAAMVNSEVETIALRCDANSSARLRSTRWSLNMGPKRSSTFLQWRPIFDSYGSGSAMTTPMSQSIGKADA